MIPYLPLFPFHFEFNVAFWTMRCLVKSALFPRSENERLTGEAIDLGIEFPNETIQTLKIILNAIFPDPSAHCGCFPSTSEMFMPHRIHSNRIGTMLFVIGAYIAFNITIADNHGTFLCTEIFIRILKLLWKNFSLQAPLATVLIMFFQSFLYLLTLISPRGKGAATSLTKLANMMTVISVAIKSLQRNYAAVMMITSKANQQNINGFRSNGTAIIIAHSKTFAFPYVYIYFDVI